MNAQHVKQAKYFDLLRTTKLHPQVRFTLLRICGAPRLKYLCETMPPSTTSDIARDFDLRIKTAMEDLVDAPIGVDQLHDRYGAGLPRYHTNRRALYETTERMATQGTADAAEVELTTSNPTTHSQHQLSPYWLMFDNSLEPATFVACLALRLGTIPKSLLRYTNDVRLRTTYRHHGSLHVASHAL
jgi:hypothetical protein